jgi:hypothetical protein
MDGVRFVVSGKYNPPSSGILDCDFVHLEPAPPRLSALSRAEFAEFNKQVSRLKKMTMKSKGTARAANQFAAARVRN